MSIRQGTDPVLSWFLVMVYELPDIRRMAPFITFITWVLTGDRRSP